MDMNGIIHKFADPKNNLPPYNEDAIIKSVFDYIDRIFSIVRPDRLIYMAFDGVAPRARMTLQRSRRF
jgi:5'-3' exoribonuclease 2